jgi:hypothetical protein
LLKKLFHPEYLGQACWTFLCRAGNFSEIWFVCRQHEVQKCEMYKYAYNYTGRILTHLTSSRLCDSHCLVCRLPWGAYEFCRWISQ